MSTSTCHTALPIWVKFDMEVLQVMSLSNYLFHENLCNGSHVLHRAVMKLARILYIFRQI
jgi:hypothetical protein